MKKGKLDEELARLSEIVHRLVPNAMLLLNESFAATNEREGSEIAKQVVHALLEKGIKIFYVPHLYAFAHSFFERKTQDTLFLRAERRADRTRTFRLAEGEPEETSYGEDLYRRSSRMNRMRHPRSEFWRVIGVRQDSRPTDRTDDEDTRGDSRHCSPSVATKATRFSLPRRLLTPPLRVDYVTFQSYW